MSVAHRDIDDLMEDASEHLSAMRYFAAERLCEQSLRLARSECDFERMARICLPLQEVRRQRFQQAVDIKKISIVDTPITEEFRIRQGCYLIRPPMVGADARRLRVMAFSREVPIAVVCIEPMTRLGLIPVVAIGQTTIRVKIDPPADLDKPTLVWFQGALEALGDAAIAGIDRGVEAERQVDALLAALDAHPEHEKLHQELASVCRLADVEKRERPASTSRKVAPSDDDPDAELTEGDQEDIP